MKVFFIPWVIALAIVGQLDNDTGWHHISHGLLIANIAVAGIGLAMLAGFFDMRT